MSLSALRPAQPISFWAPTQPIFCLFYPRTETNPTISWRHPFKLADLCAFFTYMCVYKYVLVLSKLMQLWEFSVVDGFFNIFLLAEFETIWNAAILAWALWGTGGGIGFCQMEKDKTGVMICCSHAAKPTTVNYCCNNLLPVAKGSSPAFLCRLGISVPEGKLSLHPSALSDCSASLRTRQTANVEARRGKCLVWGWTMLPGWSTISLWWLTLGVVGRASCGTLVFTVYSVFCPACLLADGVSVCGHVRFSWHHLHSSALCLQPWCGHARWPRGSVALWRGLWEMSCSSWFCLSQMHFLSTDIALHLARSCVLLTLNKGVKRERARKLNYCPGFRAILQQGGEKVTTSVWESFQAAL